MIHLSVTRAGKGPRGLDEKTRVIGIEKDDLAVLAKDGALLFELPTTKIALILVKGTREEFLAEFNKLSEAAGGYPTSV